MSDSHQTTVDLHQVSMEAHAMSGQRPEEPADFLEIAAAIEARPDSWCFMYTGEDGQDWTSGSALPERAAEAIRHQANYLRLAQEVIDEERTGRVAAEAVLKMDQAVIRRYETALRSIAANTCCDRCREAALWCFMYTGEDGQDKEALGEQS